MILKDKKILIMGLRNKWSIAYGIAQAAHQNGATLLFTYRKKEYETKMRELVSAFPGSQIYQLEDASEDEKVEQILRQIKEENGAIDGIVHAIANANPEDLHRDFIETSKEGYWHALEVSSYSFVMIARIAKKIGLLREKASLVTLSYLGADKVIEGYNIMGVAKAALESSVRYLANNLGKENMRVNAISAGPIKTLSAKGIQNFSTILGVVEEKAPLHLNVTALQVGKVASFLLSDLSDCMTGQIIYADNGYHIMGA